GRVAAVEVFAHLVLWRREAFAGMVIAARGIDEDARVRCRSIAIREQPEERLSRDLRGRVPDGHVERPGRDGALAVPSGLLVGHQGRPDAMGIEVVAGPVEKGAP